MAAPENNNASSPSTQNAINNSIISLDTEIDNNHSLVFCGGGDILMNGMVVGSWFYCDSPNGDGSFVFRITIYAEV